MKIAIMQPYFFPYLGYFQLLGAVDEFVVFDDVNFINRGWINRNNLLINGAKNLFTIPLKDASQNKKIRDIEILQDGKWQPKLLKTIELTYKKAPGFEPSYALIERVVKARTSSISELATLGIKEVVDYLRLETKITATSSQFKNEELKGQTRIIDIVLRLAGTQYVNLIGGTELYSHDAFNSKNLKLTFIKPKPYSYAQFKNEFVPNLSMIDVLMFNSKEEIINLLNCYSLA